MSRGILLCFLLACCVVISTAKPGDVIVNECKTIDNICYCDGEIDFEPLLGTCKPDYTCNCENDCSKVDKSPMDLIPFSCKCPNGKYSGCSSHGCNCH